MKIFFIPALVMLVLVGCRHAPVAPEDTGASSFTVVEVGRAAAETKVITGEVSEADIKPATYYQDYIPAAPLKNQPLPVYPAQALKAKAGAATMGVRVAVGTDGKVIDIGPSLLVFSTPGPFAEDFLEAVKAAVRQWRFRPAEILYQERVGTLEASYIRITRREATEAQIDLSFSFTATGGVQAGK